MFEQGQRAPNASYPRRSELRRETRLHNPISATVFTPGSGRGQAANLRDLNTLGAFFYSNIAADQGQTVALEFVMSPTGSEQFKICCEGIVVRVESGCEDSTSGIAVQFSRYDMSWVH